MLFEDLLLYLQPETWVVLTSAVGTLLFSELGYLSDRTRYSEAGDLERGASPLRIASDADRYMQGQ